MQNVINTTRKIETNLMDNYTTTYSMYTFLWQTPTKKRQKYLWKKTENNNNNKT